MASLLFNGPVEGELLEQFLCYSQRVHVLYQQILALLVHCVHLNGEGRYAVLRVF